MWNDNDMDAPRRRDRRALVNQVEAAAAAGLISDVDKASLLHGINSAATRGELKNVPAGVLNRSGTTQTALSPQPTSPPPPLSGPVTAVDSSSPSRLAPLIGSAIFVIVCVAAAGIWVGSQGMTFGPAAAKVLTTQGLTQLVQDAEDDLGSTQVVEVNLYEKYAMVEVLADGSNTRTVTYQYDGDFDDVFSKGSRTDVQSPLVDLTDIDVPATLALMDSAPAAVGLPAEKVSHITIRTGFGLFEADAPSTYVYVNSEFDETGYVRADLAGKVLDVHTVAG